MDCLIGNLGRDPELKFSQNGLAVAKFSMAVTERVNNNGTWSDGSTTWYTVACFRNLAEHVTEVLRKGDRVIVAGRIKERSYTKEDGTEQSVLEVEAQDVGKAMSVFKGFQRTSAPTGMVTVKEVLDGFPGAVTDEAPF